MQQTFNCLIRYFFWIRIELSTMEELLLERNHFLDHILKTCHLPKHIPKLQVLQDIKNNRPYVPFKQHFKMWCKISVLITFLHHTHVFSYESMFCNRIVLLWVVSMHVSAPQTTRPLKASPRFKHHLSMSSISRCPC